MLAQCWVTAINSWRYALALGIQAVRDSGAGAVCTASALPRARLAHGEHLVMKEVRQVGGIRAPADTETVEGVGDSSNPESNPRCAAGLDGK